MLGDRSLGLSALPDDLSSDACHAVLERTCVGHLAYNTAGRIDAAAIRLVFLEGWIYFTADRMLRRAIAENSWAVISVLDVLDAEHVASVVVCGTCYQAEGTGSAQSDAAALRGIVRLRDREPVAATQQRRLARRHSVLRLHIERLHGVTMRLPCSKIRATNMLATRQGA